MARSTRPPGRGLPTTTSSTSRSVRSLATASSSGTSPFMGTSLEDVTMSRPGTGSTSGDGRNTVWSTPTGTTVMRSGSTPIWATMSVRDDSDTVTMAGSRRATRTCMRRKPNQRRVVNFCQGLVGVVEGQLTVDGDRMVQGGEKRPAVADHAEHPRAKALVVVDQVEVAATGGEKSAGPQRVRPGLAEAGRAHDGELQGVEAVGELPGVRDPEGVGLPVEVEAGDGGEPHPVVELGPRLAGEDLDRVAQLHQLAGQVAGVDALAPAAGVAPVDEEGDPQAARPGGRRGDRRGQLDVVERSQEACISRHRWRGDLAISCTGPWHHDPTASPDLQVVRKQDRPGPHPTPNQPRTVTTT